MLNALLSNVKSHLGLAVIETTETCLNLAVCIAIVASMLADVHSLVFGFFGWWLPMGDSRQANQPWSIFLTLAQQDGDPSFQGR